MNTRLLFLVGVGLLIISADVRLNGHAIWFAERSGDLAFIYGEGAEDGDMVKRLPLVKGVAGYDASGAAVATKLVPTDRLLFVDVKAKPVVITGLLDNGIWTVAADNEEINKGKSQVPNAKSSGHYLKYAVHLRGDLKSPLGALPGQVLQITPVNAALPKQKGEALKLRALFRGKPLANAEVIVDFVNDPDAKPVRTAKDGTVTLRVRNNGLNVISVVHDTPTDNAAETDKVQHRATLSFVVARKAD